MKKITILAGGVGGSKLVKGFAQLGVDLTVIGNTGDDIERYGLWVSPDVDILTYTLAGLIDPEKGWGFKDETFHALDTLHRLGEETWMGLGDRDLGVHIFRTRLRNQGVRPTEIAERIAHKLGVSAKVIPPTDDFLQTQIKTSQGSLNFQEYYLREKCEPEILSINYAGKTAATATAEAVAAIEKADLLVIAPSNPIASIGPMLAVAGIRKAIHNTAAQRVAVCPVVGGVSLKGPTDKMLVCRGLSVDPLGIAKFYEGLIDCLVIDEQDQSFARQTEVKTSVAQTVMKNDADKKALAQHIMDLKTA